MMFQSYLLAFFATLTVAAPASLLPDSQSGPPSTYPIGVSGGTNAKVSGRLFQVDGKTGYFAGTNAWWLAHLSNSSDVDKTFTQLKETGYKIVRVWGFGDTAVLPPTDAPFGTYFHYLNASGGYINYGSDGIPRLDYVVSTAEKYGINLVLPFVNNWGDMGGIAAYSAAFGSNATSFYTNKAAQKAYLKYIKVLVTRYKKSTAIFAWELGNEPRCNGCPTSTIYNWATTVSKYIKSLDSGHMVTLGDEGWYALADGVGDGSYAYGGGEGVDFTKNLGIKTLDYGTFHLYPNSWGYNYSWGTEWIQQHDATGAKVAKPVILEEYGTPFPYNHTGTEGPWQAAVLKSGLAADQIWQHGSSTLSAPLSSISDVNTIVYESAEYATLGKAHAQAMLAK